MTCQKEVIQRMDFLVLSVTIAPMSLVQLILEYQHDSPQVASVNFGQYADQTLWVLHFGTWLLPQ